MWTERRNFGITEFRTCWKQYTPVKLRFAGGINITKSSKLLLNSYAEPRFILHKYIINASRQTQINTKKDYIKVTALKNGWDTSTMKPSMCSESWKIFYNQNTPSKR